MISVKDLLPDVLAKVARDTGRARSLKPVWDEVVGAAIARNATPVSLQGQTLVVSVAGLTWATELSRREGELKDRLERRLGKGTVTRLRFQIQEPQ